MKVELLKTFDKKLGFVQGAQIEVFTGSGSENVTSEGQVWVQSPTPYPKRNKTDPDAPYRMVSGYIRLEADEYRAV